MYFKSIDDAKTYYLNSGLLDWNWFDGFDENDFIDYLYRHSNNNITEDEILYAYLVENGENPEEYY